jgi:glutamyl/glutaminyl-tRNA synthetase
MVELFDLEKVHVTAAKFDIKKLQWMNGEYIRRAPAEEYRREMEARLAAAGLPAQGADLDGIARQLQPRTKFYSEIPGNCAYFFTDDYEMDPKAVEKRLKKEGVKDTLLDLADRFEKLEPFTAAAGEAMVKELSQGNGMGPWVHPIRVAVSGRGEGIGLFEMCELLGKDRTVTRLRRAASTL